MSAVDPGFSSLSFIAADPTVGGTRFIDEIQETMNALTRAEAAVYPVDARGVAGAWDPGRHTDLNASYLMEDSIAEATGGHAYYGTNDLKTALTEATEKGSNYYTLSYSPTNQDYDGRLRHIRVEVPKHEYHLAYRRSYYGNDPNAPRPKLNLEEAQLLDLPGVIQPETSLYVNMQHGAPTAHQLIFAAHVHTTGSPTRATPEQMATLSQQPAYFKAHKKDKPGKSLKPISLQTYAIDYKVLARQLGRGETGAAGQSPALELAVAAFDDDGAMLNAVVQKADTSPVQEQRVNHQVFYVVEERIDVPVTAAWLRFGMRDTSTDHIGAMEVPLPLAPEPQHQAGMPAHGGPSPHAEEKQD
jgi:hypothetical protein